MAATGNDLQVQITTPVPRGGRSSLPMLILAVLFGLATFLTWYFTWFGRALRDEDIAKYLADEKHPRHVQHALLQIQDRLARGDTNEQRWYPKILELAGNPETEFRLTAAWIMGFDNKSDSFHEALRKLLKDPEPLVRRNAALALVRFNDSSGREELLATLKPYPVTAPAAGSVTSTLNEGSPVSRGTLLARIDRADGSVVEVRSTLPGKIESVATRNGAMTGAGDMVMTISSDANSLWEVLRGLALIGQAEDLPALERYIQGVDALPDRIKEQAALTAKTVRSRANQKVQSITQ